MANYILYFYKTGNRPSLKLMANPLLYVLESSYYLKEAQRDALRE